MEEELVCFDQKCHILQENSDTFLQSYNHMKVERDQVIMSFLYLSVGHMTCSTLHSKLLEVKITCGLK